MRSRNPASARPMIQVKRAWGQARCSVRTTGSVWHTSPSAESFSTTTERGGAGRSSDTLQLSARPQRLGDRNRCLRLGARIRVGDGDAPEALAPEDVRRLAFGPFGIEQRRVTVRVAVWPAIDGDAENVLLRIEAAGTEHAPELVAHLVLEGGKRGREQLGASGPVLRLGGQAGFARHPFESQHARLLGRARVMVVADAHRIIQVDFAEIAGRTIHGTDAEFFQR